MEGSKQRPSLTLPLWDVKEKDLAQLLMCLTLQVFGEHENKYQGPEGYTTQSYRKT